MTTEEIAEYLRVEVVTVRRLVARGDLSAYRIGGEFRFMIPDVEAFVKSQRVGSSGEKDSSHKFTERMLKVLSLADVEAQELQHHYIGTEHFLLGLLREGEGIAAIALARSGVNYPDAHQHVLNLLERGQQPSGGAQRQVKAALQEILGMNRTAQDTEERGLTRRASKVLELAIDEARRFNHHYVGTEHLLLALVREGEGIAAKVLVESYGLKLAQVRQLIVDILSENRTSLPVPEQAATLLAENEQGVLCAKCGARNPDYFHHCFNCGLNLSA